MIFVLPVTIPANTARAAAVTSDLLLAPGVITKVDVEFPSGCVGLVSTFASRGASQIFPTNAGQEFAADDETITWPDEYEVADAPFSLRMTAWNTADSFAHTVTWRLTLRRFPGPREQQLVAAARAQGFEVLDIPTAADLIEASNG